MDVAGDDIVGLLAEVSSNARDAVGISENNTILVVNSALLRLFGYESADRLVGRPFLDLLSEDSRPRILQYVRDRAAHREVPGVYRVTGLRAGGEPFEAEVRTTSFGWGGRTFALALLREVDADAAGVRELYDAFFQDTAIKLLIDPATGLVVDANEAAVRFYGWTLDELRGKSIRDINTASPAEVGQDLEAAATGSQRSFRFRHRLADGRARRVEVHTGPVELRGRRLLLSIIQDVTEREELEERLDQARQLEAVGRLAGGVAHDFNNLLTVVLGCADLIRPSLDGAALAQLEDLVGAAHRASRLTRQLLAVGRRQQLAPRTVDLAETVRAAEPLLRRAAAGVELLVDVAAGQRVEFDPDQLEQVLLNLVLNSVEAGARRVSVTSSSERDAFDTDFVVLTVSDDGAGMDEATRTRVFEPFFTTRHGRGSGLGLASVYGIVSQSGGQIDVRSDLGVGTRFALRLARRTTGDAASPVPARGPGTVLWLVDDHDDLREVLVQGLVHAGFEVTAFRDGEEALAAPGLDAVSVLITDQVMPGIAGIGLGRALQELRPELRVLLISGELAEPRGLRLPSGWSFLQKPFSTRELAARVRELCRG